MTQRNDDRVHVIAEAGTNHNGSVDGGKRLIDLAARGGADTVKFQIIDADQLYLPGDYEFGTYNIEDVRQNRRKFALSWDQFRELDRYAADASVPMTASIFDADGLAFYKSLDPPYVKIASTDLTNVRLLRQTAASGLPMIVSTGMATLGEIERAVGSLVDAGASDLTLMHCVSAYPAPLEDMNLSMIDTLGSAFGFPVGLSDHTESSIAACLAVGKGVRYIEKHFTLDRTAEGFDHAYAAEGDVFVRYVSDIRAAEAALRPRVNKTGDREAYTAKRARRSLYAKTDLSAGRVIGDDDVLCVRPSGPMAADQIDDVVGHTLRVDVAANTAFQSEMLQ